MTTQLPKEWPIARYRFDMCVTKTIFWPDYAGSAIRGAIGRALRKTACMTHRPTCPECMLYRTCPYSVLFESAPPEEHVLQKFSQIPHPYVVEAPAWGRHASEPGEAFSFHMVLIGRALHQLPLIIFAVQRAFAGEVAKGSAELVSVNVEVNGTYQTVYGAAQRSVVEHPKTVTLPDFPEPQNVTLCFATPLRLQNNGRNIGIREIEPGTLLNALVRRIGLLMEFHARKIEPDYSRLSALARGIRCENQLRWQNWSRYSSRQDQKIRLGGVVGNFTLFEVPAELQTFLYLGQWTHLGKSAVFGLGKYKLLNTNQTRKKSRDGTDKIGTDPLELNCEKPFTVGAVRMKP